MERSLPSVRTPFFGFATLAAGLAAAIAAPSCGGDDPPAGPGPIALDAFATEFESAYCDFAVKCGLMPDKDACLRLDRTDGELLQLMGNAVFGDVAYSADAARSCVDAVRARSCDRLLSATQGVESACKGVFTGAAPAGGPCLVAGDCSGDSVCDFTACEGTGDPCCKGVCAATPPGVPVGGDCSMEACVPEAYCDVTYDDMGMVTSATCQQRHSNGEPCEDAQGCQDGQGCDFSGASGKCYILSREGAQCNPNLEDACLSFDNWCDPAASKCVKLPGAGEPCTPAGSCRAFATCDGTTCRMRPVEGEACAVDGPRCLGDLYCDQMTLVCTAPPSDRVCVTGADG